MKAKILFLLPVLTLLLAKKITYAQSLDEFHSSIEKADKTTPLKNEIHQNGYTTHWNDSYLNSYRYGNLFKMVVPDVESTLKQSKVDIAEELGIPGLTLQEGFINSLLSSNVKVLKQPSFDEFASAIKESDLLVYTTPDSETGKKMLAQAGDIHRWKQGLTSHQFNAKDFASTDVFILENGQRKIFAVISPDLTVLDAIYALLKNVKEIVKTYDLKKGWMGVGTLHMSVTADFGHPMDVIGSGMNEGNSWFVFSGYNEFRAMDEYKSWMTQIGEPAFVDVGTYAPGYSGKRNFIFGCDDYKGMQEQDMEQQDFVDFVENKNGYIFRQVYDDEADSHDVYDGYIVNEGNKEQLDNKDLPFINLSGPFSNGAASSMVLFLSKGEKLTKSSIINAIKERREIAVLPEGKIIGPDYFRNAMQMLLLDRVYLEEYFGDRIDIQTETDGSKVKVTITNHSSQNISGNLKLTLPTSLSLTENEKEVILPAHSQKDMIFEITIQKEGMGKTNSIGIDFLWDEKKKSTVTMLDMPPAITAHKLLYGQTPIVQYPVSVLNYTNKTSFPVKVQVFKTEKPGKVVFEKVQQCELAPDAYKELFFDLKIPDGNYIVTTTALDCKAETQLGVGKGKGNPVLKTIDINNDGIDEYQMENDKVKVTLIATGARVIEYIVKSKDDNVLFKLWPDKPVDDNRPFRKRGFYPFGGFEDFLGQPSLETHKIYDAEIIKDNGSSVSVKMTADYFGNRLEKIFTLYDNSPLLEVKFKLNFINQETDMIGPQPILELGEKHDTIDLFVVPDVEGLLEYRMRPEEYYGHIFTLKEGWNAGTDTKENVSFVGAYPVDQPEFLHMWMNHPRNGDAHHYYAEFQPWIRIIKNNTFYFSYYMWADEGSWENGLKELRNRNLITKTSVENK